MSRKFLNSGTRVLQLGHVMCRSYYIQTASAGAVCFPACVMHDLVNGDACVKPGEPACREGCGKNK